MDWINFRLAEVAEPETPEQRDRAWNEIRAHIATLERERDAGKSARIVADTVKKQLLDVAREADCAPPELVNTIRRLRRERDDALAERDGAREWLDETVQAREAVARADRLAAELAEAKDRYNHELGALATSLNRLEAALTKERERAEKAEADLAREREWRAGVRRDMEECEAAEARAEKAEAAAQEAWSLASTLHAVLDVAGANEGVHSGCEDDACPVCNTLSGTAAIAAAHDARVGAEALEDAATALRAQTGRAHSHGGWVADWLDARAAELRAGGESVEGNAE